MELAELKRLGYIQRFGSDKVGAWKLAENGSQKSGLKSAEKTTQKTTQKTAVTTQKILAEMKNNPFVTIDYLCKVCGLTSDGLNWYIR